MTDFSVGEVGTEGFRLIGRKPLAVLGWGLFIFIAMIVPICLLLAWMGSSLADMVGHLRADGDEPSFEDMMHLQGPLMALNPLISLLSLVGRAVLTAAIFRAVLEPKNSAFAYLRLGAQELWLAIVLIVEVILLAMVAVVAVIPIVVAVVLLGTNHATGGAVAVGCLGALALVGGMIWLALRLSMALPLSFVERRFALFESWNFTKGHAGNLFLTALLVVVLVVLMETAAWAVIGVVALIAGVSLHPDHEALMAFFHQPPQVLMTTLAPIVLGAGLLIGIVASLFSTVAIAPWAAAYKVLARRHEPTPGVAGLSLGSEGL